MITDIVLALALTGSLRGQLHKDDVNIDAPPIRTREELERHLDDEKMEALIDSLDTDGDKQISPLELAELELKGAETISFELTPDDAFALADGSVREDGEPETAYVPEEHIREWFIDAVWANFLEAADENGDQYLDDAEWEQVLSLAYEGQTAVVEEASPSDDWTLSFADQLTAVNVASTGAAALVAAVEVAGRLTGAGLLDRRRALVDPVTAIMFGLLVSAVAIFVVTVVVVELINIFG